MKIWREDILGVLATQEEVFSENGRDSIFINSENSIQVLVKIISTCPEGFPNIKFVSCFTSSWAMDFGFEDDINSSREERIEKVEKFLNDQLIIFQVEEKFNSKHEKVFNARNVRLTKKNDSFTRATLYHPIPMFNKKISNVSNFDEFIQKIRDKKFVGTIDNSMIGQDETPEIILWEDGSSYPTKVLGNFFKHVYAFGGFQFTEFSNLINIDYEDEWLEGIITNGANIAFLTLTTLRLIEEKINKIEKRETGEANLQTESKDEVESSIEDIKEIETDFLNKWHAKMIDSGLQYAFKDLINFHTAMKSSSLVILTGTSGVGKTKIIDSYQKMLGLKDEFKFISVSPSWTEDSDLIGYADTLNMIYRSGDTGLIEILIEAQKQENADKIYIVCFDEMNLAKVEHYFSQFLSILELEPNKRFINLYIEELENRLYNTAKYPPYIQIKDNVRFVGTVNIDESTHHFSNKVLDRANVIELEVLDFVNLDKNKVKKTSVLTQTKYFENYRAFINKDEGVELSKEVRALLWDLHKALIQANKNIGFGPRVVKQIDTYMKNLPSTNALKFEEALDLQIKQRILTKLRGSEEELKELTGQYNLLTKELTEGKVYEIFEKYKDISNFDHSKEAIKIKARELSIHGYAF